MRYTSLLIGFGVVAAACSSFGGDDPGSAGPGDDGGADTSPDGGTPIPGIPEDFALSLAPIADPQTIIQGRPTTVPITLAKRGQSLQGPITIKVTGLPDGVTAAPLTLVGTTGNLVLSATLSSMQGSADAVVEATIDSYKATTPLKAFVRGAPGTPDRTWGTSGQVIAITETNKNNGTIDLLLGKTDDVYAVSGAIGITANASSVDHVVHLDKTGVIDTAYGSAGVAAVTSFGPTAAALGADGRVVLVGGGTPSFVGGGAVGRSLNYAGLSADGKTADFSYASSTPPGTLNGTAIWGWALALRDDGHAFFGWDNGSVTTTEIDCGMTHVDPAGTPAPLFGSGGSQRNTVSTPVGMALRGTGDDAVLAVVSAETNTVDYVAYNSKTGAVINEIPKTVTIPGARRATNVWAQGLVQLADKSIVIPFNGTSGLYLLKLDLNGDPVTGFGTAGIAGPYAINGAAIASGITVDGNGKLIVALDAGGLVRFTPTGDIDADFGDSGLAPTSTVNNSIRRRVVVQSGGRILASGPGASVSQVVVSAYWP